MYSKRATSCNAKFLLWPTSQAQALFPIRSLQVDGGSEFRDEFEQACQDQQTSPCMSAPEKTRI